MIKKHSKLFVLVIMSFFVSMVPVFAKEMTLEELGTAIGNETDDEAIYAFVIGDYVFTSELDGSLTTKDIMLASRSIKVQNVDKKLKTEPIYDEMTIFYLEFDGEKWDYIKNIDGSTEFNNQKIDVRFIDYNIIVEESEMKVSLGKADEGDYKKNLKDVMNFTGNSDHSKELTLDVNGKLTGLILKNDNLGTTFTGEDKTGYYFAFVVEVPGATDKTTVKMSGKKTINATYNNFDVKSSEGDSVPGIAAVFSLDPNSTNKKIIITVDLDGDGSEYSETVYEIDWSELKFQEESEAYITTNIPDTDKDSLANWGYIVPESDYVIEEADNSLKLTGIIAQQHTNEGVFDENGEDAYYFAFNVKPELITEGIEITLSGAIEKEFKYSDFGGDTSLSVLYKLDDTCPSNEEKNCEIIVKVDIDGKDGDEYLPTTYTIDYNDVIFRKNSKFTIESANQEQINKIQNAYKWNKPEGYETKFETQNVNEVKVTGLIPIVDDLKEDVFSKDHLTKYYLAYVIKLDKPATENTTVKFVEDKENNDDEKIIIGNSSFDNEEKTEIYVLKHIHPKSKNKTFTIEVDLDGNVDEDGKEYSPYTVTVDFSELKFQTLSYIDVTKTNIVKPDTISKADKAVFDNWGYELTDDLVKLTLSQNIKNDLLHLVLRGDIVKQENVSAFSGEEQTGYYVPISIKVPDDYAYTATFRLKSKNSENEWKIIDNEELEDGYLTVLFAIYDTKNNDDKKITFEVDLDGAEKEFLPQTYTIDYSEVKFKSSKTITYEDGNGGVFKTQTIKDGLLPEKIEESPELPYHTFMYWTKDDEEYQFDEVLEKDIILTPHWNLEVDEFITDVVNDLNDSKSKNSDDFSREFILDKTSHTLIFKILQPGVTFTRLDETSIPGAIAYVLEKDEVKSVTIKYNEENSVKFSKDDVQLTGLLEPASDATLKMSIITGMQNLLNKLVTNIDDYADIEGVDDIFDKDDFHFDMEIEFNENIPSEVKEEDEEPYTFKFSSNFRVVDKEKELDEALADEEVQSIYVKDDFEIKDTKEITRPLLIIGNEHTITLKSAQEIEETYEEKEYIFVVNSKDVIIDDLKLTSKIDSEEDEDDEDVDYSAKRAIQVKENASLITTNLDVSGNGFSGIKVESDASFVGHDLKCDDENYSHPAVWKDMDSNALITLTKDGNVLDYSVKNAKSVTRNDDGKWTDKELRDPETGQYYHEYVNDNGTLKDEYKQLIDGQTYTLNYSDLVRNTERTTYYLEENHSKLYVVVFMDTNGGLRVLKSCFYDEAPQINVSNNNNSPFFKKTIIKNGITYKWNGWSTTDSRDVNGVNTSTNLVSGNIFPKVNDSNVPTGNYIYYYSAYTQEAASTTTVSEEQPEFTDEIMGYNSINHIYQAQQDGTNVEVSGLVTESKNDEYYFALTLNPIYTNDIEISVKDLESGNVVANYTNTDFENEATNYGIATFAVLQTKPLTILLKANKDAEVKKYEIVVDSDGAEKDDYAEYTLTINYSDLSLGTTEYFENAAKNLNKARSLKIENNGTTKLKKEYNKNQNKMVTIIENNNEKIQFYLESIDENDYVNTPEELGKLPREKKYQDIFQRTYNDEEEGPYDDWEYVFYGYEYFLVDDALLLDEVVSVDDLDEIKQTNETTKYKITISDTSLSNYLKYMYSITEYTKVKDSEPELTIEIDREGNIVSIYGSISIITKGKQKTYNFDTKISNIDSTTIDTSKYINETKDEKLEMRKAWNKKQKEIQDKNNQK